MNYTETFKFAKPLASDNVDINILNENMNTLDSILTTGGGYEVNHSSDNTVLDSSVPHIDYQEEYRFYLVDAEPEIGKTYTIHLSYNGTTKDYMFECADSEGAIHLLTAEEDTNNGIELVYLNDLSFIGYPDQRAFGIIANGEFFTGVRDSGTITIDELPMSYSVVTKIPEKFLPDTTPLRIVYEGAFNPSKSLECNRTYDEIIDAIANNRPLEVIFDGLGLHGSLSQFDPGEPHDDIVFCSFAYDSSVGLQYVQVTHTSDNVATGTTAMITVN